MTDKTGGAKHLLYELKCPLCKESKIGALFRLVEHPLDSGKMIVCHANCSGKRERGEWISIASHLWTSEVERFKEEHPEAEIHTWQPIDPNAPDPPNFHRTSNLETSGKSSKKINPKMMDGEAVCTGKECPRFGHGSTQTNPWCFGTSAICVEWYRDEVKRLTAMPPADLRTVLAYEAGIEEGSKRQSRISALETQIKMARERIQRYIDNDDDDVAQLCGDLYDHILNIEEGR